MGNPSPPCNIEEATIRPATLNRLARSASVLCIGKKRPFLPSKRRGVAECDNSARMAMVKNSLFGPPPSIAGSPSNVTFKGFPKSKLLCLKKATQSEKMFSLLTVNLGGATGGGFNLFRMS